MEVLLLISPGYGWNTENRCYGISRYPLPEQLLILVVCLVWSNKTSAIAFQVCLHHLKLYLVPDEVIKSLVVAVGSFHQDEKS